MKNVKKNYCYLVRRKKRWKTVLYLWKFQGSMEQTEIFVQSGIFSIHLCGETSVW